MDINNKFRNTKSQFIYKSGLLSGYIANRLDNNQNVKRYLYYNTINPLGDKGLGLDNNIISQPDITKSLLETQIFDGMFNEYMEELHQSQIYIHTYKGQNIDDWGNVYIAVNILIPKLYEKLSNFGEKRSFAIASEIEDMFQDICVARDNTEEFLIDKLGNVKFKIVQFDNGRLSKTNNIITNTVVIKVGVSTTRLDK